MRTALRAVVGERQERAAVRNEAAVQREAVHDRGHAELAHAVVDVVAAPLVAARDASLRSPCQCREVRAGQVGRAAEQFRQRRRERLERDLRGLARGDGLGLRRARCDAASSAISRQVAPAARRAMRRVELGGELGMRGARSASNSAFQSASRSRAALARVPRARRRRPGSRTARAASRAPRASAATSSAPSASPCAFAVPALVRRALADDRLAADQRRLVRSSRCACAIAASTASTSWPSTSRDHVPAVGLEALRRVVGEPAVRPRRRSRCRCRRRARSACRASSVPASDAGLVRDAFHQAAVAEEDVGVVVDDRVAGAVELAPRAASRRAPCRPRWRGPGRAGRSSSRRPASTPSFGMARRLADAAGGSCLSSSIGRS